MEEYIKIPHWINDLSDIKSENIVRYISKDYIKEKKISLEVIRNYYKLNPTTFQKFIDELSLRGFEFRSLKNNNVLPNLKFSDKEEVIKSDILKSNFENIDFEDLKISNFILRFDVKNNNFFDNIPIRGFLHLNKLIDLEKLKQNFIENGFEIKVQTENFTKEYKQENSDLNEPKYLIENCFFESSFKVLRNYFIENGIFSILQIEKIHLEEIKKYPGLGVARVQRIYEKLKNILIVLDLYEKYDLLFLEVLKEDVDIKNYLVKDYLIENKYNKLREFFNIRKIKLIKDITLDHIEAFKNYDGVGVGKYQDALNIYHKINDTDLNNLNRELEKQKEKIIFNKNILSKIGELKIGEYVSLYLNKNIEIEESKNLKIADIDNMEKQEFEKFNIPNVYLKYIENYRTIDELCSLIDFNENEMEIFEKRYIFEKNMVQIGEEFTPKISRARVEQILSKKLKVIKNTFELFQIERILRINKINLAFIPLETMQNLFKNNNLIFRILKDPKINMKLKYSHLLEGFMEIEVLDTVENKIKNKINSLPEYFHIDDYLDELIDFFIEINECFDIKEIENTLKYFGYEQKKEYFILNNILQPSMIKFVFDYFIDTPLDLNNIESINKLNNIILKYFGEELIIDNIRNLEARLGRIDNIILVNQLTYFQIDKLNISESLIKEVSNYLVKNLEEKECIGISSLIIRFKEEFKNLGLDNKYGASSFVKFYLQDDFYIKSSRIGDIYKVGVEQVPRNIQLEKVLDEYPGKTLKEYTEILVWPDYKIYGILNDFKNIYCDENNRLGYIQDLGIDEEEIELLREVILMTMKNGYTTIMKVIKNMRFSIKLNNLLQKYNFKDQILFSYIIRAKILEVDVSRRIISKKGENIKDLIDIFKKEFQNEEIERNDINLLTEELGYSKSYGLIDRYIKDEILIETGQTTIVFKENFPRFSDEDMTMIIDYIESKFENNEYLSLNTLKGYRKYLPDCEIRWNPYLIKSVLCSRGYRAIYRKNNDYRYDKIILVRENSFIKTMEDLIYFILKNEYQGNLHEDLVINYLSKKEIIYTKDYSTKLPWEIYNESTRIKIDNIGVITLE